MGWLVAYVASQASSSRGMSKEVSVKKTDFTGEKTPLSGLTMKLSHRPGRDGLMLIEARAMKEPNS